MPHPIFEAIISGIVPHKYDRVNVYHVKNAYKSPDARPILRIWTCCVGYQLTSAPFPTIIVDRAKPEPGLPHATEGTQKPIAPRIAPGRTTGARPARSRRSCKAPRPPCQ
jgi:hypothetical protein